jgi:hypothetical protein
MPIRHHYQEITMFRKSIIAVVLGVTLLFLFFTLVSAQGQKDVYQTDMNTPTAAPLPVDSTPVPDLPLSGAQSGTGTCPMMSGTSMTGTGNMSGMGNMTGMQGMSGMNMGNMSGMQGMQNMPAGTMNMGGMAGMNMTNMNSPMAAYATPWYSNPWLMLGWVVLVLVVLAVLAGIVLTVQTLKRRSEAVVPVEKS